jgi:hypothetical protein
MISAFFLFFGATELAKLSRQPMLDKIKLKLFDLKGSIDELNERTRPEDFALRIVRHKNYKGSPHYFGRVDISRADLLMSESVKEDFELFFVIGPIADFSSPDDQRLEEVARSILMTKVRVYREKAIKDYLFK